MVARFWRWTVGASLIGAVLLAGFSARAWSWPLTAAALLLIACLALPGFLVALTRIAFLLSLPRGKRPPWRLLEELRAWATEPAAFCRGLAAMMVSAPRRPAPAVQPIPTPRARPVLMIHGIFCNRGVWRHWFEPLRAAGFAPVRAIDLEPVFADIEHCAAAVAAELRALQRQCDGERVSIIAHSMGGLVARAALRVVGPGVIRRIVTIASPHHGTLWARLLPCPPMRQMRADSSWLAALNASQESHSSVPLTCIFSEQDEFILPAQSAAMKDAARHALRGAGHFGVLASRRCLALSMSALRGE